MDENEYVETSDVEELEEIRACRKSATAEPGRVTPTTRLEIASPPRKRIKLHHGLDDEFAIQHAIFASPASASSIVQDDDTEESPLKFASHQSSPLQLLETESSAIISNEPRMQNQICHQLQQVEDNAFSIRLPRPPSELPLTTTPPGSPRSRIYKMFSHYNPSIRIPSTPSLPIIDRDLNDFSPRKLSLSGTPSSFARSPSSPLASPETLPKIPSEEPSSPARIPPSTISRDASSVPRGLDTRPTGEGPELTAQQIEHMENISRYPLRARHAIQKAPYSVDKLNYKNALRSNPDAIIRIRSPDHHHRRQREDRYEETQGGGYEYDAEDDEDAAWERREAGRKGRQAEMQRRKSKSPDVRDSLEILGLEDLPSDDNEEEREMRKLSNEARKLFKEKERERKAKEKEEREAAMMQRALEREKRRPRPIPIPQRFVGDDSDADEELNIKPKSRRRIISESERNVHHSSTTDKEPSAVPNLATTHPGSDDENMFPQNDLNLENSDHFDFDYDYQQEHPLPPNDAIFDNGDGVLRNTRDTPIEVLSDSDHGRRSRSSSSHASMSVEEPLAVKLSAKEERALRRMMPAFMIPMNLKPKPCKKKPRQQSMDVSSSHSQAEEAGPLLPGHTRVRRASHPRDVRDIKGDTESSSDGEPAERQPPKYIEHYHHSPRKREVISSDSEEVEIEGSNSVARKNRIIDISEDRQSLSDDSQSSSDAVDDEFIHAYIEHDDAPALDRVPKRLREGSLIDWMLSGTRNVGGTKGKRKATTKKSRGSDLGSSSRYKFDIVTRDGRKYGRERQSLLTFGAQATTSKNSSSSHGEGHRRSSINPSRNRSRAGKQSSRTGIDERAATTTRNGTERKLSEQAMMVEKVDQGHKRSHNERKKSRREAAKTIGVYTLPSVDGARVVSGKQRTAPYMTVDLECEEFYSTLAPRSLSTGRPGNRSSANSFQIPESGKRTRNHLATHELPTEQDGSGRKLQKMNPIQKGGEKQSHLRDLFVDCGVSVLQSGLCFDIGSTFLGKGRLNELVKVIKHQLHPPVPIACLVCGIDLQPTMNLATIKTALARISNGIFEFATALPDADNSDQRKEWEVATHTLCQLISAFLASASADEKASLREAGDAEIVRLVTRLQDLALDDKSLDTSIFACCWFAVELAARLVDDDITINTCTGTFRESVASLVRYLLIYGITNTMKTVTLGKNLDDFSIAGYTAELWISLIHLLGVGISSERSIHPLWPIIEDAFKSGIFATASYQLSEAIWDLIFNLCALSQFNVHGMTTGSPRLPASWGLVIQALRAVDICAYPDIDCSVEPHMLDQRDSYAGIVTARCFHLWERWSWKLDGGFAIFNELISIFRSRKFGNLRHEKAEYPKFITNHDWSLLSQYELTDTAYVLFMKLVVQASKVEQAVNGKGKITPKVKKLLSMATPVGSVQFTKSHAASHNDLAKYHNRIVAVAITVYLDVEYFNSRILNAPSYANFADAGLQARTEIIRGMRYLAILSLKHGIQLQESAKWIAQLSLILAGEFDDVSSLKDEAKFKKIRDRLYLSIQTLFGAVREIVDACKDFSVYPEPMLLSSLRALLQRKLHWSLTTAYQIQRLIESYLTARAAVIPAPIRPKRSLSSPVVEEDSQEQYGDCDYDPSILDELNEVELCRYAAEEDALRKAIIDTQLGWLSFRLLRICIDSDLDFDQCAIACDVWMGCWIGCSAISQGSKNDSIANDNKTPLDWRKVCWDALKDILKSNRESSEFWQRRIYLSFMFKLLRIDPLAYLFFRDSSIEILMESLASDHITIENEYVAWVLSIDCLQHSLFQNASCISRPSYGDYRFSAVEFSSLRLPLLKVIFENLEQRLREHALTGENSTYVGFCIKFFTAMKNIVDQLKGIASERCQTYVQWCRDVFQILEQHPKLSTEPRMLHWMCWGRNLT